MRERGLGSNTSTYVSLGPLCPATFFPALGGMQYVGYAEMASAVSNAETSPAFTKQEPG